MINKIFQVKQAFIPFITLLPSDCAIKRPLQKISCFDWLKSVSTRFCILPYGMTSRQGENREHTRIKTKQIGSVKVSITDLLPCSNLDNCQAEWYSLTL